MTDYHEPGQLELFSQEEMCGQRKFTILRRQIEHRRRYACTRCGFAPCECDATDR